MTLNEGQTCTDLYETARSEERKWGNEMINQKNNGQWTTKLGEGLVFDVLKALGKNPRSCKKKPAALSVVAATVVQRSF